MDDLEQQIKDLEAQGDELSIQINAVGEARDRVQVLLDELTAQRDAVKEREVELLRELVRRKNG